MRHTEKQLIRNTAAAARAPSKGWSLMRWASGRGLNAGAYRRLILVFVILALWIISSATGVTARFGLDNIRRLLEKEGLWGVLVFTALFSAGQLLRIPGTVFIAAAVIVYGRSFGTLLALLGAIVSVNVSFVVIRMIAGRPLVDFQRPVLRRLLSNIDSRPVVTVALLRLIFQTGPPLNYTLPMTSIRLRDHVVGSSLGLPVPVVIMALFSDWLLKHFSWLHRIL